MVVADWPTNDTRFLFHPAMKELSPGLASVVFMGHEPGSDHDLVTKVNRRVHDDDSGRRCGHPVPVSRRSNGGVGCGLARCSRTTSLSASPARRSAEGTDMLTVLCHTEDDDGNSFTDEDIVNHMIFLMMAAHDTSTSTTTTMAYHLAANPDWQERCRDESARLGDGPLDIESLEKLETLDLVMNESLRLVTPLPFNMRQTVRGHRLAGLLRCRPAPTW